MLNIIGMGKTAGTRAMTELSFILSFISSFDCGMLEPWRSVVLQCCLAPRMDCIEVLTEGGRESGDMVNLIIRSMIHESLLFRFNSFFKFLAQPALK